VFSLAALLTGLSGCSVEPPAAAPPSPFQEFLDRGLGRYLGQVKPSETRRADGTVVFEFAVEDGPMCLRGGPYRASARDGAGDGLIIFLQGGGACWSTLCLAFDEIITDVPPVGILNPTLAGNPVADWDVGYVPYCDGSLFCGDAEVDEDEDGTIDRYHRGLLNLTAALEAIKGEYPRPSRILMTGISAGAYGTMFSAMLARSLWPGVRLDVVADGGVGLGRPGEPAFIQGILDEWGITSMLPESCVDCFADGHVTGYASWALARDPNLYYLAVTSLGDFIIGTLFLGIGDQAYGEQVAAENAEMAAAHPSQFASFVYAGSRHTTLAVDSMTDLSMVELPFPGGASLEEILGRFDVTEIEGVTVAQWLTQWLDGDPEFRSLAAAPE
jgi:hypothetical protein